MANDHAANYGHHRCAPLGRASPVKELEAIANEHNLRLMFDASHGFGCTSDGALIGSFGECEVFSFHATKFFNTFEGGAVVTNNGALAEKMRLMRNFGFAGYDNVIYPGTNGKMTEIAAAMGLTNLEDIDDFVAINRRNYHCYRDAIASIDGLSVLEYNEAERNNFQYLVMEVAPYFPSSRDRIVDVLHAENVLAQKYFWPGCHNMQPTYRRPLAIRECRVSISSSRLRKRTKHASRKIHMLPIEATYFNGKVRKYLSQHRALDSS